MIISFNNGLGDQLQAIPVVKEMLRKSKEDITVVTKYPRLWDNICPTIPFKPGVKKDKRISYIQRRPIQETTQFQDVCIEAGIKPIELKIDWRIKNWRLINQIKEDAFLKGKEKVCLYKPIDIPCGQGEDAKEMFFDLMPRENVIDEIIEGNDDIHFVNIKDFDTSVGDLIDVAFSVDIMLGQIGHFAPLSEAVNTKSFIIFPSKGRNSKYDFVKYLTPKKIINKPTTVCVYDDYKNIAKKFKKHVQSNI